MTAASPQPFLKKRRQIRECLLAVGSVVLTTVVRFGLNPILGQHAAFIMYFPALVFSAWVGGWIGGLLALALSTCAVIFFFLSPTHALLVTTQNDQVTLCVFVVVGLSVSALSSSQRKARRQAQHAARDARQNALALATSEARYRRLLETANEGIMIVDADDQIRFVNPRMAQMLGEDAASLEGRTMYGIVFPEDQSDIRARREKRRQDVQEQYELRLQRRDGTELWVQANITVQREEEAYAGTFGLFTDITARRALERERERLLRDAQARAEREALINRVNEAVRATTDPEAIQAMAAALLGGALGADRCYFSVYDPVRDAVRIADDWHRSDLPSLAGDYSLEQYGEYMNAMYAQGTAVIDDVQSPTLAPSVRKVLGGFNIRAFLAVPLLEDGQFRAAVAASIVDSPRAWTPDEVSLVEAVLTQTKTATEAARIAQREKNIAAQLQAALQPDLPLAVPGLALAKRYKAALAEAGVGGDFYDVFAAEKGATFLIVGDLSGKGLAAAAQVATVRNMLRFALYNGTSLGSAVTRLNQTLAENGLLSGFATLFVGRYEGESGCLSYVCCGQEPALVRRADTGQIDALPPTGPVLGGFESASFQEDAVVLAPGDVLAVFTDGLTEVGPRRTAMLGLEGVAALFAAAASDPPHVRSVQDRAEETAQQLIDGVDAAAQGGVMRDDVCLLVAVARSAHLNPPL